mmetsp:Transcript_27511/g.49560  ORF Transcript_27511/g.49560 Transcript_27511/m.49560 type:complete len:400 (+) Transcript_27511:428-1627(+)
MGNCCNSKARKPPLPDIQTHTDILTEGKSHDPASVSAPKPNLNLRTHVIETLETQEDCGSYADASVPSLFATLDRAQTSSMRQEEAQEKETERIVKVAGAMHRLGRAFYKHERFDDSSKMLKLAHDLYASSGLYLESDTCLGDLLLIQLATQNYTESDIKAFDPSDDRIALLDTVIEKLSGNTTRRILKKLKKLGLESLDMELVEQQAHALDKVHLKNANIEESLVEVGHCFRLLLNCPEQSLSYYEEAIHYAPSDSRIYFYLALASKAIENYSEAVRYYRQALVLNPTYADCHYNLGNLYCEELNHLLGAEDSYQSALISTQTPDESRKVSRAQILHMLSRVYYKCSNLPMACKTSLQCLTEPGVNDEHFIFAISLISQVAPYMVRPVTQQRRLRHHE